DYIAMVTLAQVNPDADASGYPSSMNLFASRGSAANQLTDWDLAYLDALYATDRDSASLQMQQSDIAGRMIGNGSS
ncbi:MAG: hypothetical protein AB7T58_15455, partial [Hyphomonadaceae bacterium]